MNKDWNKFVASHKFGTIHQTKSWGDFQAQARGTEAILISGTEAASSKSIDSSPKFGGLFIRQRLPFGFSWLYCPRGPLCNYENPELAKKQLQEILKKLKPIARKERVVFIRIDPPVEDFIFPSVFKKAHAEYQPEHTLIIDLLQSEEQILANMKPKGRYNIKVAQKHNVKIRAANQKTFDKDLNNFYALLKQTCVRDGFQIHSKSYYENMLLTFMPQNLADLYLAEYKDPESKSSKPRIVAGIIVIRFKDTVTYYFGASDHNFRHLMAPYLLQWHALTQAKNVGYRFYDFLGIAPLDQSGDPIKQHRYSRITDFKLKFGGTKISYAPAHEYILKPFVYILIKFAKFTKKLLRF